MTKKTAPLKLDLPFEAALEKLETIVDKLESGEVNLDKAISAFEEGMQLAQHCQQKLTEVNGRVEKIMKDYAGQEKIVAATELSDEMDDGIDE